MKSLFILLSFFALTACQSPPPIKESPEPRPITLIESYAKSASDSLRNLADIERSSKNNRAAKISAARIDGADELYQAIDFSYSGQLDDAVVALMQVTPGLSEWKLSLPGFKPVAPVLVSVYGRDQTAFDYLQDMGEQVGSRAVISIDPEEKTIHIVYGIREIRKK